MLAISRLIEMGSVVLNIPLADALDRTEGALTGTDGQKGDSLVDTAQRGNIDGCETVELVCNPGWSRS